MKPNEIKKGLECCSEHEGCYNCPYYDECGDLSVITADALAYINQLEAENKAFGEIIKKSDDEISELRKDLLKRQNLEESFRKARKQFDQKLAKTVKLERADAIKEFSERVNEKVEKALKERDLNA